MRKLNLCLTASLAGCTGTQSPGRSLPLSAYGPPADSATRVVRNRYRVPHVVDDDACLRVRIRRAGGTMQLRA